MSNQMVPVLSGEIVSKVSDAFNFNVERFPLSGPDGMRTPWYALFRSDTHQVVGSGSVTSRYEPHQTDDVLALVEATATAFDGVADVKCFFRDGHHVTMQPTVEYRKSVFGTADNVFPRVMIDFGYDMTACRAAVGYYRDLCMNMSRLRTVRRTVVSIRHTSGLRNEMNDLIQTFSVLRESWADLTTVIEEMESRTVNMVDFLNAVYGEPQTDQPRAVTMHRHRTEAIFRRLSSERFRAGRPALGSDWQVSGWEAYNAVQGYVQHDSRRRGRPSEIERIVMANSDAAVLRAERVALGMAV